MTNRAPDHRLTAVADPGCGMSGETEPTLDSNPCRARDGSDKLMVQKYKRH
jgi:hypothetical protein